MENDKIYSQSDIDNIIAKVKEKQSAKYEKTHISIEQYNELKAQYDNLVQTNKVNSFKEVFKTNGGNMDAFEDFITSNKDVLDLESDKQVAKLNELKETKKFYFNNGIDYGTKEPQNQMEDLVKNDGLVEGTIYKNQW